MENVNQSVESLYKYSSDYGQLDKFFYLIISNYHPPVKVKSEASGTSFLKKFTGNMVFGKYKPVKADGTGYTQADIEQLKGKANLSKGEQSILKWASQGKGSAVDNLSIDYSSPLNLPEGNGGWAVSDTLFAAV